MEFHLSRRRQSGVSLLYIVLALVILAIAISARIGFSQAKESKPTMEVTVSCWQNNVSILQQSIDANWYQVTNHGDGTVTIRSSDKKINP